MKTLEMFQPKWNHAEEKIALKAVAMITNLRVLARIASTGRHFGVREIAVEKLTDEKLLAEVAKHRVQSTDDWEIGKTAARKLTDQGRLAEVAAQASDKFVRKVAVLKLTDQALLAAVAKQPTEGEIRAVLIERLTEPALLAEVTRHAASDGLRFALVQKLDDQAVLADIARGDHDWNIRKAAVEKLTDQAALGTVAKQDRDRDVRAAALRRLTDQPALAAVATGDDEKELRTEALRKIDDQNALTTVATKTQHRETRVAAVEKLTDQAALAAVAKEDSDAFIRALALQRLDDQRTLALVAGNDSDGEVRRTALARLIDERALATISTGDSDRSLREMAARRLAEQTILTAATAAGLAPKPAGDQVKELRPTAQTVMAALRQGSGQPLAGPMGRWLTEQFVIAVLGSRSGDKAVRTAAIRGLTEPGALVAVVQGAEDQETRRLAIERLVKWEDGHRYRGATREDAVRDFDYLCGLVRDARELGRPPGGRHGHEVLRWSWAKDGRHHYEVMMTCSHAPRGQGGTGTPALDSAGVHGREIADFARRKLRAQNVELMATEDYRRIFLIGGLQLDDYFRLEPVE
ncbi:MAG: hypothetical protein WCL04_05340 [Verrucomicrobiota bacterium]